MLHLLLELRTKVVFLALVLLSCHFEAQPADPMPAGNAVQGIANCPTGYVCNVIDVPIDADTHVWGAVSAGNYGDSSFLETNYYNYSRYIILIHPNESLLRAAVPLGASLLSAEVQLTPVSVGSQSAHLYISPMQRSFVEKSGSAGATYLCASDSNVGNYTNDCALVDQWDLANSPPWSRVGRASFAITPQSASAVFDVKSTVLSWLGTQSSFNGWSIENDYDDTGLGATFGSRESGRPPVLKLLVATPAVSAGAPALTGAGVTRFYDATKFLYSPPSPSQTGLVAGTIVETKAAVIRGRVLQRANYTDTPTPLAQVTVSVLGHPEYGVTSTRADGTYDLAVNGGATLVVSFDKTDWLTAQRQVQVPQQDYAVLDDVALVKLDAAAQQITLGSSSAQTVRGTPVTGSPVTRRATLVFPSGTTATSGGVSKSSLYIRATEFTVGAAGAAAMPATLPPESAYTYAVELSASDALTDAPLADVQFNKDVSFYVENFLHFPVGTTVPVGYYDRTSARWIPSASGRVVAIVGITAGTPPLANVDVDGDGTPDPGAEGITNEERAQLASAYSTATTTAPIQLWRALVTHFTPWDLNWGWGPPNDAIYPNQAEATPEQVLDDPTCRCGSIIECENQVLGETLGVPGTGMALHYRSDRAAGYYASGMLEIPVTGPSDLPGTLRAAIVEVTIAGRKTVFRIGSPSKNQKVIFGWDGLDIYGRRIHGAQPVSVAIGYVYDGVYKATSQFGYNGGGLISGDAPRLQVTLWQRYTKTLRGTWDAATVGLGGWTLGTHHTLDPVGGTLLLGNGQHVTLRSNHRIETIAGNGSASLSQPVLGSPALQTGMNNTGLRFLAVRQDGRVYFAHTVTADDTKIYYLDSGDVVRGIMQPGTPATSNLDPAYLRVFKKVHQLAVGPDGYLYVSEDCRISRLDASWNATIVAGQTTCGGDGSVTGRPLATSYQFVGAAALSFAFAPDGTMVIASATAGRVYRVDNENRIRLIGGTGSGSGTDVGVAALNARIFNPLNVAVDTDGRIYVATNSTQIRRIDADGIVRAVAGWGAAALTDNAIATSLANLPGVQGMATAPDGSLYIGLPSTHRLWRLGTDGVMHAAAGSGNWYSSWVSQPPGDNGPALAAALGGPSWPVLGPDGVIDFIDWNASRVRRYVPPMRSADYRNFIVPSPDGREVYSFDAAGRHLKTETALLASNRTIRTFGYDAANRLQTIVESPGNLTTTIQRDPT